MTLLQKHFQQLFTHIKETPLKQWHKHLAPILERLHLHKNHEWRKALEIIDTFKEIDCRYINLKSDVLRLSNSELQQNKEFQENIQIQLMSLVPWRKGPFNFFGVEIDAEWRSDHKWKRLETKISPLKDRLVLDVGCGNGYHLWKMHQAGAKTVIGVEPHALYVSQFHLFKYFAPEKSVFILPLRDNELPKFSAGGFDTVFSMGVLYHRRDPLEHLMILRHMLRPEGELVLETLVVDGDQNTILTPPGKYAAMNNVWFLPSVFLLKIWLKKLGFEDIKVVDVAYTSTTEQRSTKWAENFPSLIDFLDPNDPLKTIEGHPAPKRAILSCRRALRKK